MSGLVRSLPRPRVPSVPAWPTLRRRLLIALLLIVALVCGYMLWLRNSSLVAVDQVVVTGAEQNPGVERALQAAGLEQTTLNVDPGALQEAVADNPAVRSLSAAADFPHALTIEVDLREPIGFLKGPGVLVAGDGVILEGDTVRPETVPTIGSNADDLVGGGSVKGEALEIARVLGAAPVPLLAAVDRASIDADFGVLVELQAGLELRFGDAGQADLKWRAAAAVLAQEGFAGAAYLDLSVADRPVAGGVPESSDGGAEAVPEVAGDPAVAIAPPEQVSPVAPAPVEPAPALPETTPAPPVEAGATTLE